jgi:membrane-bound lytic murein transglycosylase B
MPSSFLLYAKDFDGDGKRDIWHSTPDVLASIANYLSAKGWQGAEGWGLEVLVPASATDSIAEAAPLQTSGCLAERQMTAPLPIATWQKLGVRTRAGGTLPPAGVEASLITGIRRHFLVYPNYQAILSYNCVNAYGLSVGLLADAAAGKPALASPPRAPMKKKKKRLG